MAVSLAREIYGYFRDSESRWPIERAGNAAADRRKWSVTKREPEATQWEEGHSFGADHSSPRRAVLLDVTSLVIRVGVDKPNDLTFAELHQEFVATYFQRLQYRSVHLTVGTAVSNVNISLGVDRRSTNLHSVKEFQMLGLV